VLIFSKKIDRLIESKQTISGRKEKRLASIRRRIRGLAKVAEKPSCPLSPVAFLFFASFERLLLNVKIVIAQGNKELSKFGYFRPMDLLAAMPYR